LRVYNASMKINLSGITPNKFLHDYWQKKPLLVRGAVPGFKGLLTRNDLITLACRDDAQSRLITQQGGQNKNWQVKHGPFLARDFSRLPKKQWTLLVQDVNHFLSSARDLLLQFNFIPHARLDDLMVSYAPKGGGVGPHVDSYDVFLLQGMGRRRWQISSQKDHSMVTDAPLKILRNFRPQQEWVLEAGDMLYLPPGYAHNGVAEDDCMTYSIGFRAPSYQELATQFLVHLQDHIEIGGMYSDPDLGLQRQPAQISTTMLRQAGAALSKIKWGDAEVEHFLGLYLTEPKPHVFFTQPSRSLTQEKFAQRVEKLGCQLDLKSRMLFRGKTVFINGDAHAVGAIARRSLRKLANNQLLPRKESLNDEAIELLYQWYLYGYIEVGRVTPATVDRRV